MKKWEDFEDKMANYIATELSDYDLTINNLRKYMSNNMFSERALSILKGSDKE